MPEFARREITARSGCLSMPQSRRSLVAGSGDLGGAARSRLGAVCSTSKVGTWRLLPEENSEALTAATTCPCPAPRPEAEAVLVLGRDRLARTQPARHNEGALIRRDSVVGARLRLEAGFAKARNDGGDDFVVNAFGRTLPAFVRGIGADLALEARRITAIDGDHIGSESEIGDEDDLRLRFGASRSDLEAAVNSAAPASATTKLLKECERIGIKILRRGNGIFARHPRVAAGTRARTVAGKLLFETVDWPCAPVNSLGDDTAEQTTGPDQFIGCE